ncbi:disease resistance-responsive (dirigent-likeprotein) family protein [Striga asiatica]|uniref:Dirigent protein n=1 Tax=Striga asiatica TaxID=4170 RepID=A0A5A7R0M4_STRAF|nr:disease resistance-responsive (dirigent-likeprotein) family protein [Striga asiatica]
MLPINVAMANSTPTSPTFFGLVAVLDDPVRIGPSLDAEIVGRAKGWKKSLPAELSRNVDNGGMGDFLLARGHIGVNTMTKMEKQIIILCIYILLSIALLGQAHSIPAKKWSRRAFHGREKVTRLQVYVQDILTGPSPTNIAVARANTTFASPTLFGLVAVIDDPVRTGPSLGSEIVGRAQGLFAFASLEEISLHMTFDIFFTGRAHNGSTLSLIGRNPYPRDYRELSVVGGSGDFRLARGQVGIRTVSVDSTTGNAIGPSPNAETVGRAQGFFAHSSLNEISIHMTFDIVFTKGEYSGSTLNLVGRNPYPREYRELSIVGGSGAFRLARGFVEIRTVSAENWTGIAFFQYNITILHY